MKRHFAILGAFCFSIIPVLLSGCSYQESPENEQLAKQVQELERKVETLEQKQEDLILKSMISSGLVFQSPLQQFFQSPEFWENTYDSRQADCSRRCIRDLQQAREQCKEIADDNQRLQCFQEASDRASNCHQQCARL